LIRPELPLRSAPEPACLLPGLPPGCGVRLLDARGANGWGCPSTPGGGPTPGLQLLATDPEVEFCGGQEALAAALAWLAPRSGTDPWDRLLIGSLAYELGAEFESAVPGRSDGLSAPVQLAGFRALYLFDPRSRRGRIAGSDPRARERLAQQLAAALPAKPLPLPALKGGQSSLDARAFGAGVEAIRAWIRRGDAYQVNLSRRLSFSGVAARAGRALFMHLSKSGEAPFAAYLETPSQTLISNSPERFLRVSERSVETCPIKGTAPRGATPEQDRENARSLARSEKDAAEHLMIVDLERNDLGRVCEIGSVRVSELAALRSFASVHHLVSTVTGRLREDVGIPELLAATFPGGSVTGAPKVRAMQIIDALEPVARGVYTGAIGFIDAAGGMDLSVAIRTAVLRDGALHLHAGGGIVADSSASAEWLETEAKLAAFRELWSLEP